MGKRLVKHFLSILGGQFLTLIGTLLLVPIFLRHWTAVQYGEWLVLSSAATYLGTFDLGMNSAVGNRMLASYTKGDMKDYFRCQHSAAAFYLYLALGASALMGAAAFGLPLVHWMGLKVTPPSTAAWVAWLLGLQILWMMPVGLFGNTFRTIGQPAKTQWITNFKYISFVIITVLVLVGGGGMRALALWQLVPMGLTVAFIYVNLKRQHPELLPGLAGARWETSRELLKPSLLFAGIMVATALALQGSVLVVSTVLGGAAVAVFVTTRTLCNAAMQVVRTVNNAAWPDVTILHAQGETARLRTMHRLLISVSTCLCIAVAAALWFAGPQIVSAWTHGKLTPPSGFIRWMLAYLVFQSPWLASSTFMIAINSHKVVSRAYLLSSGLGLAAAVLLVRRFGLSGVPMGLILGEAVACYYFVIHSSCQVLEERTAAFLGRLWLGLGTVAGLVLGAGWLAQRVAFGPNPAQWLEIGTVTTVTALLVTWALWLSPQERVILSRRFRPARPKP